MHSIWWNPGIPKTCLSTEYHNLRGTQLAIVKDGVKHGGFACKVCLSLFEFVWCKALVSRNYPRDESGVHSFEADVSFVAALLVMFWLYIKALSWWKSIGFPYVVTWVNCLWVNEKARDSSGVGIQWIPMEHLDVPGGSQHENNAFLRPTLHHRKGLGLLSRVPQLPGIDSSHIHE